MRQIREPRPMPRPRPPLDVRTPGGKRCASTRPARVKLDPATPPWPPPGDGVSGRTVTTRLRVSLRCNADVGLEQTRDSADKGYWA